MTNDFNIKDLTIIIYNISVYRKSIGCSVCIGDDESKWTCDSSSTLSADRFVDSELSGNFKYIKQMIETSLPIKSVVHAVKIEVGFGDVLFKELFRAKVCAVIEM